jgi:hypothetical protein
MQVFSTDVDKELPDGGVLESTVTFEWRRLANTSVSAPFLVRAAQERE